MGRRNKLQKFADILSYDNVYENFRAHEPDNKLLTASAGREFEMRGRWSADCFDNSNPIIIELACGRGEYTLALAQKNPNINYIGVDVKGARIWQGSRNATAAGLSNVAFLRTRIEMIANFFEPGEVAEIWITFPDPFLKDSKSDRRLTSHPFLDRYSKILVKGGLIHLKTDDPTLYEYSVETLGESQLVDILYKKDDIYAEVLDYAELEYKTYYEQKHIKAQKTIKYIRSILK